jgi:polyisoprenoid-binding protein YceI
MTRFLLAAAPAALLLAAPALAEPAEFRPDPTHTFISASWDHGGYATMPLYFTNYETDFQLDLENPENSSVEVTFNLVDGLWVGPNQDRFLNHLNSADFFETEANPTATFVGTSFETEDGVTGVMTGDLTMNGMTGPVSLNVTLNKTGESAFTGGRRLGFSATGTLVRSEWDMGFAAPAVSDEIAIEVQAELHEIVPEEEAED